MSTKGLLLKAVSNLKAFNYFTRKFFVTNAHIFSYRESASVYFDNPAFDDNGSVHRFSIAESNQQLSMKYRNKDSKSYLLLDAVLLVVEYLQVVLKFEGPNLCRIYYTMLHLSALYNK